WTRWGEFVEIDGPHRARFRHGLIRDTAYAKLPFRRRRELHLRAAVTIESSWPGNAEAEAELLSLHFFSAQAYEPAWRYARIAAERARARYANADAAVLYERALAAARRLTALDPA